MSKIDTVLDGLISRKDAAYWLGVHPNTLDRAARAVGLTRHSILGDNRVFYRVEDIEGLNVVEEIP